MKKRILSLFMVFSMVFMLITSVSALTKNDQQTLTVNKVEKGTVINVYQIIKLNVNDSGNILSPTFQWTDEVARWFSTANGSSFASYNENGNVTDKFSDLSGDAAKPFWEALAKDIKILGITPIQKTATGTSVDVRLNMGEYLILANGGTSKAYMPQAHAVLPRKVGTDYQLDATATVNLKSKDITIEKEVTDNDDKTVGIGDTVEYSLHTDVPEYPENASHIFYQVVDNMSTGLTYDKNVKVYTDEGRNNEVPSSGYEKEETNRGFKLKFNSEYIKGLSGKSLYLTYSATVNENAVVGRDPLKNTATLEFSNDPYNESDHKTLTVDENVYTYNICFQKESISGNTLTGAKFELLDEQMNKINLVKIDNDGNYRLAKAGETVSNIIESSTENFKIDGLDTGIYYLVEKEAPNGYVLPVNNQIKITLVDNGPNEPDGRLDENTSVEGINIDINNDSIQINNVSLSFTVVNKTAGDLNLPITGDSGIYIYLITGAGTMIIAILLLITNKKKNDVK